MFGSKKRKIDELSTIKWNLENDLKAARKQIEDLQKSLERSQSLLPKTISEESEQYERLSADVARAQKTLEDARNQIIETKREHRTLEKEIVEMRDAKLLQEVGYYEPLYKYSHSEQYAAKLQSVREEQKQMIRNKTAVTCNTEWTVNNNRSEGRKWTNHAIKNALIAFNLECDNVIAHVKYHNFESMKARINKCYDKLSELNSVNALHISMVYLNLKIEELTLVFEMELMKQKEKEELRAKRELQREQAKVEKELEEERKRLEKENKHYQNLLQQLNERKLMGFDSEDEKSAVDSRIVETETKLVEIKSAIEQVDYRKANQRAGYVYIISNIGSFGEGIYKIGMTRRLDPLERISELSGAAVPFRFDVHALIFSDDAPSLESVLHNTFSSKRVNVINNRKEFFKVPLEEIESVVKKHHDKTVEFSYFPEALEYRVSQNKERNK